jgi:UDP-GlcNAc:undecaprenyl-phosphate GlcNAc-1-phosphate transferase
VIYAADSQLALNDLGAGVPLRELALVGLTAAIITYFATGWVRVIARRLGAVAYPRERDVHLQPTPRMGGLAMYVGVVCAVLLASQLPALTRGFVYSSGMPAVVVAGGLIMAIGLIDDRWGLDALTKFAGQITAASVLVTMGVAWSVLYIPGVGTIVLDQVSSILLTLALTVAIVNAMNFVDGLDGLAAGVVGIGAVAFFLFCYQLTRFNDASRATTSALLSAALAGACAGFLVHNFHPARLFMGDSGSMLIGLVLSASAVTLTGQFAETDLSQGAAGSQASLLPTLMPLLLPISLLVVPMLDLVMAVIRRTRAGMSPFAPDKQHLHHRLLEIGHSQRRAVLIMWLWAGLVAFGTVLVSLYTGPWMWMSLAAMSALTITLTFLLPVVRRPAQHV